MHITVKHAQPSQSKVVRVKNIKIKKKERKKKVEQHSKKKK